MTKPAITRINGGLEVVTKSSATTNNGFYAPQLTTVQSNAITASDGGIIYNTDTLLYQVYQNGEWWNLNNTPAAMGAGLLAGSAATVITSGAKVDVEVGANEVDGFIYYDTTNDVLTARVGAAWVTITVV